MTAGLKLTDDAGDISGLLTAIKQQVQPLVGPGGYRSLTDGVRAFLQTAEGKRLVQRYFGTLPMKGEKAMDVDGMMTRLGFAEGAALTSTYRDLDDRIDQLEENRREDQHAIYQRMTAVAESRGETLTEFLHTERGGQMYAEYMQAPRRAPVTRPEPAPATVYDAMSTAAERRAYRGIEAQAQRYVEDHKDVSLPAAIGIVARENPDLYAAYTQAHRLAEVDSD
ncbi:MAG: hypothetical protein AB7R89_28785 [Dehalococcoidia bacterium]